MSEKTTIRLTREDRDLIDELGRILGHKLGKIGNLGQSDVIRYSIRRVAEQELARKPGEEGGNEPAVPNG